MHSTLFAIALLAALAWLWRDSLRARELAARVSRRACDAEGVQFLDDTVALVSLRPVFDHGRPALRRVYRFEFSRRGDDRACGSVMVTGHRLDTVYVSPPPGELPAPAPGVVVHIERARRREH